MILPQKMTEKNVWEVMVLVRCKLPIAIPNIVVSPPRYLYGNLRLNLRYWCCLNAYHKFIFKIACAKNTYPRGLKWNCKKAFSCVNLATRKSCGKRYTQAMNRGCNNQISKQLQRQFVRNFCKKACNNCIGKIFI